MVTTARAPGRAPSSSSPPERYVRIPHHLLAHARYAPVQVGIYGLIARLFLLTGTPVPLSASDIIRYDPTLSRGAAQRALARLVAQGWLVATDKRGHKTTYLPTWGCIAGTPLPWRRGVACLNRPRHIRAVCLDLRLLDLFLGKLTPHPLRAASVTRYVTAPLLALSDVGSYAVLLAGLPATTPALTVWHLVQDEQPQPVPDEQVVLAQASQGGLRRDQPTLSARGFARAGFPAPASTAQPLFFVPQAVIASLPSMMPAPVIDSSVAFKMPNTASATAKKPQPATEHGITWESWEPERTCQDDPPQPPAGHGGGMHRVVDQEDDGRLANDQKGGVATSPHTGKSGVQVFHESCDALPAPGIHLDTHTHHGAPEQVDPLSSDTVPQRRVRRRERHHGSPPAPIVESESARLLSALHVLPHKVRQHGATDLAQVRAAIALAQARSDVRDQAAFVVSMLDRHRDSGWDIVAAQGAQHQARGGPWTAVDVARYGAAEEQVPDATVVRPPNQPATPVHDVGSTERWSAGLVVRESSALPLDEQSLRAALRSALPRTAWPVIDAVQIVLEAERCDLRFVSHQHLAKYGTEARAIVRSELAEAGVAREVIAVHHVARPASDPSQAGPDQSVDAGCPDWIGLEWWRTLPALLRVALRGAAVIDGQIVARSPHAQRQIDAQPTLRQRLGEYA